MGNHGLCVGASDSGRADLLRTLVLGLAMTCSPDELIFLLVDVNGAGTFRGLDKVPHVTETIRNVVGDPTRADRLRAVLTGELTRREEALATGNFKNFWEYERARARGLDVGPVPALLVVIDEFPEMIAAKPDLKDDLIAVGRMGRSRHLHMLLAGRRFEESQWIPFADYASYRIVMETASAAALGSTDAFELPSVPGFGYLKYHEHDTEIIRRFMAATVSGQGRADETSPGSSELDVIVGNMADWWSSQCPGRGLPEDVDPRNLPPQSLSYDELVARNPDRRRHLVPIGVDAKSAPVYIDFDANPHFQVFGDGKSGKTNLLRTIIRGIADHFSPEQAVILVVDFERSLRGFVGRSMASDHLLNYLRSPSEATGAIRDVRDALRRRLPGPEVPQEQLKNRSWWSGPELFVVIDDYEVISPRVFDHFAPWAELLARAKDIGLHLITARRAAGAARQLRSDAVLKELRNLATPGIIMNGEENDGALVGTVQPSAMPPGRGTLVDGEGCTRLVQLALTP